jgi:hypothetical protein
MVAGLVSYNETFFFILFHTVEHVNKNVFQDFVFRMEELKRGLFVQPAIYIVKP